MPQIFFDTETTGLSALRGDRIIEIGAVKCLDGKVIAEFSQLVNSGVPIAPGAQAVHGISAKMLQNQLSPQQVFTTFHDFIQNSELVAHNAKFDRSFLSAEFQRLGISLKNKYTCTLSLSRNCLPGLINHKLETVYRALGGIIDNSIRRHRALDDARMVAFIWHELQKK